MLIKNCNGYELEKEKPNTSEDFFNRSEVTFVEDGEERTFHLLYIRYFDERLSEFTPYNSDPVFTIGEKDIHFKDIVGLICLLKKPQFLSRKRVYINNINEFVEYFKDVQFEKLPEIFQSIEYNEGYKVDSTLLFS
ncbi:hypothetical protein ACSVDA_22215 [Cytobacillus sp. Hm23]